MAIEFQFQGEWYKVDSPQEVVALKKYLKAHAEEKEGSPFDSSADPSPFGKWTSDLFVSLMEKIGYAEKKFLAALLSVSHPIDAVTVSRFFPALVRYEKKGLKRKLGWEGLLLLGGIQSGLVRHVRALGLEPFDVYQVHISWKNGQRTRYFTVDPGFRFAAEEQGWPPQFLRDALGT